MFSLRKSSEIQLKPLRAKISRLLGLLVLSATLVSCGAEKADIQGATRRKNQQEVSVRDRKGQGQDLLGSEKKKVAKTVEDLPQEYQEQIPQEKNQVDLESIQTLALGLEASEEELLEVLALVEEVEEALKGFSYDQLVAPDSFSPSLGDTEESLGALYQERFQISSLELGVTSLTKVDDGTYQVDAIGRGTLVSYNDSLDDYYFRLTLDLFQDQGSWVLKDLSLGPRELVTSHYLDLDEETGYIHILAKNAEKEAVDNYNQSNH